MKIFAFKGIADYSLIACRNMEFFGETKVNWFTTTLLLVVETLYVSGCLLGNLEKFGKDYVGDIVLILLHLMQFLVLFLFIESVSIMMQSYANICRTTLFNKVIKEEDIANAIEKYSHIKPLLSFASFSDYLLVQSNVIVGIYMTIIGENQISASLIALGYLLYLIVMLGDLLVIYNQVDQGKYQYINGKYLLRI